MARRSIFLLLVVGTLGYSLNTFWSWFIPPGRILMRERNEKAREFWPIGLWSQQINLPTGAIFNPQDIGQIAYKCPLSQVWDALCIGRINTEESRIIWQSQLADQYVLIEDWSADGHSIVVRIAREGRSGQLMAINAETGGQSLLVESSGDIITAEFSPDGNRIVYTEDRHGPYKQIVILDIETRTTQQVTRGYYATWMPDGQRVVSSTDDSIFSIRPDGTETVILFNRLSDTHDRSGIIPCVFSHRAIFSPDGKFLVYACGPESGDHVYLLDVQQRKVSTLTSKRGAFSPIAWLP